MQYVSYYASPLGKLLLAADEEGLIGLWLEGQKYYAKGLDAGHELCDISSSDDKDGTEISRKRVKEPEERSKAVKILTDAGRWLDIYFSGREPELSVPLHLIGTDFQREVWEELLAIPYGETRSYGEIAESLAKSRGRDKISARAAGSAVGNNPISIIVPCHRVVGSDGSLTGYAGGIDRKRWLLSLEQGL